MSFIVFPTYIAYHVVSGARPGRDFTDFKRHSLELGDDEVQQVSQAEVSKTRLTGECLELKNQLLELGIRGEGDPCTWEGLECSSECQLSSLIRDADVNGNLVTIGKFKDLQTLKLRNAKVNGSIRLLRPLKRLQNVDLSGTEVTDTISKLKVLKNLKAVNLRNTKVYGGFRSLRMLTGLQSLELGASGKRQVGDGAAGQVGGDLKDLGDLTSLKHLRLDNTETSGDIADLQHLSDLQKLELVNTEIHGTLSVFEKFTCLEKLHLDDTMVNGTLEFVEKLIALRNLHLHNTDVTGDFSSLQHLTALQELRLSNTQVVGNLGSFQNLRRLKVLELSGTELAGSLSSLHSLESLKELGLSDTKVTGELEDLQHFTELEFAHLDGLKIDGDLAAIKHLTGLRHLRVERCNVHGDITVVRNFPHLQFLDLGYTQVFGDIKAMQQLERLEYVFLTAATVNGSITAFRRLTRLKRIDLQWARVGGDLKALKSLFGLQVLGLSDTRVSGSIYSLYELKNLTNLFLSNSKVHGDIRAITALSSLQTALLQNTDVSGWIEPDGLWGSCCSHLKELNLADTQIGPLQPLHGVPMFSTASVLLPALNSLNVSGCQLNGWIDDLLLPLAGSGISKIFASGCALKGEVPNIAAVRARVDGHELGTWRSTLWKSLEVLDLSSNNLTSVAALIASLRMDLGNNTVPLKVPPATITQAVEKRIELWLENTKVANPDELKALMAHELQLRKVYTKESGGFSCRELADPVLRVTPKLFLPRHMCECLPGYAGFAPSCSPCPANTYSSEMNSQECHPCPRNSTAPGASASCMCDLGTISKKDDNTLTCECRIGEALVDTEPGQEHCESCQKLKLNCSKAGTNASTAPMLDGHARLGEPFYKVYQCLEPAKCLSEGCAEGYTGRLCSDCAPQHHESFGMCKPCTELEKISVGRVVLLSSCGVGAFALLGGIAWNIRSKLLNASNLRLKCAVQLLAPLLAALLQLVQLWSVLWRLAKRPEGETDLSGTRTTAKAMANTTEDSEGDVWASYLKVLQLSATDLQGLVAFQCFFGAKLVQMVFAVVTPMFPLGLLLICGLVEFVSRGTGIQVGLQLLTVLFIGGASGAVRLLDCRRFDGTGKVSLGNFEFRRLMPHLLCSEASWVDQVGRACAFCYGVVIPSFLAFLFAKQHLVMRQTQTFVAYYESSPQKVTLQLQMISNKDPIKDDWKEKRLVAAAAVYVSVHVKGRAKVTLLKDENAVTVEQLQSADRTSAILEGDLSVDLLVPKAEEAAILRSQGEIIRHKTLVQMLTEHSILAEIEQNESDRVMIGAKQIFGKYASCQFVWMEVCLKLASAALVSVVGSKDGIWLSIAITVGMALMVGLAQPFARPQQNALYAFSFASLAVAAVGFYKRRLWLSHAALVLPVVPLIISLARPDSQEALATRLHEDLEKRLPDGPVEVSAERVQFF